MNAQEAASHCVTHPLYGNTHGRMILGLDRVVALAGKAFFSSRYEVDGMTLFVSSGTARWLGFALRLGQPSELTSFILGCGR